MDSNVMDIKTPGIKVTIHSVCLIEGSTATNEGVFEGAYDSSYKSTMKTRFIRKGTKGVVVI